MEGEKEINIKVNIVEYNTIIKALIKMPYEMVVDILPKLQNQAINGISKQEENNG